jgi:hypothetical protein
MRLPRFSLRSLLGLAMLVAVAGYWRDLPRQNAKRFETLVNAGEYNKAQAMFGAEAGMAGAPADLREFKVTLGRQTFRDWLRGRYPMSVSATNDGYLHLLRVDATVTGMVRSEVWAALVLP